jgi:hypothetical protein
MRAPAGHANPDDDTISVVTAVILLQAELLSKHRGRDIKGASNIVKRKRVNLFERFLSNYW